MSISRKSSKSSEPSETKAAKPEPKKEEKTEKRKYGILFGEKLLCSMDLDTDIVHVGDLIISTSIKKSNMKDLIEFLIYNSILAPDEADYANWNVRTRDSGTFEMYTNSGIIYIKRKREDKDSKTITASRPSIFTYHFTTTIRQQAHMVNDNDEL